MTLDIPREYCLLGLRFDRLVEGFVDAYFQPMEPNDLLA